MGKVWVAVITKYEKKQAILVDFHFFSHEDDYNFAYHSFITAFFPGSVSNPHISTCYFVPLNLNGNLSAVSNVTA